MTSKARPAVILAIILTSYFMILLDNSVIFTGLPSIRSELGLSATELSWVQDAYTLVFGGLLLLGARAGDLIGRRLFLGAMIGCFYFTTQYLQGVLGYSPLEAGLGFFPMTVVNFAVAIAVPRLTRRFGNAVLLASGLAVTLAGMTWLSGLEAGDSYLASVALPMILIGAGEGLAFAPLTSAGISGVTATDAGAASGLVNTFHQLGSAVGLGILVAVSANATDLTTQVSTALTGSAVLLAIALVIALAVLVPRKHTFPLITPRVAEETP